MVCLYTFHVYTFFFFNDTATTEIYTLSLHDALPICRRGPRSREPRMVAPVPLALRASTDGRGDRPCPRDDHRARRASTDRKSTRLNSSHSQISYAVFCLKKKNNNHTYAGFCTYNTAI